jgi:hypothetical protein
MKQAIMLLMFLFALISSLEMSLDTEQWCLPKGHICRRWWNKKCCHGYKCIHGRCRKPWWDDNDNDNDDDD